MAKTDTASRIAPYIEQLVENAYARENLRAGTEKLQAAIERSRKRRVKPSRDTKIRRQLKSAAASLAEGANALASGRQKPKRNWGKRIALVGMAAGAGAAIAAKTRGGQPSERIQPPEPETEPAVRSSDGIQAS
jgi:hypothetical protein